jgi:uncharacterized protein (PEP-CTERM system associated)
MARADTTHRTHPGIRLALATALMAPLLAGAQMGGAAPGAAGTTPSAIGTNPEGRAYTVTPGIRASVVASDNIDLLPDPAKTTGTLFELMPYVQASLNSPRAVGYAFYGLRGQIRDGGINPTDEIRHDLRAWGDFKLTEESLRVFARASVFDINASPFGVSSFDPGAQRTNRTQYQDFELSPYLFGRFDGDGTWTARYRLRYIDPGSNSQSNTSQSLSGNVRSDLTRRQIGWSAFADVYTVAYQDGLSYNGADVDLLGWYRVGPTLRLGAGAAYSQNEILYNNKGENSGWGPSLAIEWNPDLRTSVRARWADRYYGSTGFARASHRAANWTFGLDYFNGINDGNRSGLYGTGGSSLFNIPSAAGTPSASTSNPVAQGLIDQNLTSPAGTSYGSGIANSPIVYVDTLLASVGWLGTRNSVLASVFINNRRTAVAFAGGPVEDTDQYGASLAFTHRLDARNSLNLAARQTVSDSPLLASHATLSSLWATWDYRLTPRAFTSIGGRIQRQRGDGTTVVYDEAALLASIDYRF